MKPSASTPAAAQRRRRIALILPLLAGFAVVAEVSFLARFDLAKKADAIESWTTSFYSRRFGRGGDDDEEAAESAIRECEERLERLDAIPYDRDFDRNPVRVSGASKDWKSCSVNCEFGYFSDKSDATFGVSLDRSIPGILRSMESSQYYSENNIKVARGRGYKIVMTTSLSSDVPVGYFSWAEYDIMQPVHPKTAEAHAAAFISNCGARNFRLQALEMLEKLGVKIDSYGSCHRNREGKVDKLETLKGYKFSLAFENSNEEDYVTEKFFQSLVAGSVPIVIGAPNIQDFSPSPDALIHIRQLDDVPTVAATIKDLANNPDAYNQTMRWKYDGPSDPFKALIDMAAVHSSCRLCIFLASQIQGEEEMTDKFKNRPCTCSKNSRTIYHMFVRERGRFRAESIFLRSTNLTLKALESAVLEKFTSLNHAPVWKNERPKSIRGGDELKIYRIYPAGLTQREALYSFQFKDDSELAKYVVQNPCAKLEVIFV